MKKFITITLALCMILSCFTITSSAMAKKPKKYTKVKTATYQKYKQAYNENASLRATIEAQQAEINNLRASDCSAELAQVKADLENANSMNRWVWSNLRSMGITYDSKTWTIPEAYPESYMIDGVKYIVVVPEVQEEE